MRPPNDLRGRLRDALFEGYEGQYERMRRVARSIDVPARHTSGGSARVELNLGEGTFTTGLIRAWAMVADVLAFYQERIAEEGYLSTARDPEALWRILHGIGCDPVPRTTASAYFDFTASTNPNLTHPLIVPTGTAIRAIVETGKPAETFEVAKGITVRGDWNEVRLHPELRPESIKDGTSLRFKGVALGIRPGDRLLLLPPGIANGEVPPPNPIPSTWLPKVLAFEEDRRALETTVRWQDPTDDALGPSPAAFLLDLPERLFGHLAPDWTKLPPAVRLANGGRLGGGVLRAVPGESGWRSFNDGIPLAEAGEIPVTGIVLGPGGILIAGSSAGVLLSREGDEGWTLANDGLTSFDVTAVHAAPDGSLYAGTNAGTVFRSTDGAKKWGPVDGGFKVVREPGKGLLKKKGESWQTVSTKLPVAAVRALVWIDEEEDGPVLVAATDQGVFQSDPEGGGWFPETEGALVSPPIRDWATVIDGPLVVAVAGDQRFVREPGGEWSEAGPAAPEDVAIGLAVRAKGLSARVEPDAVVASLETGEIVRWDGAAWRLDGRGDVEEIAALVTAPDGTTVVATPSQGILDPDWPGAQPRAGRIDLAREAPGVVPGSWVVLDAPGEPPSLFQVATSDSVRRTDLMHAATITRLSLPEADLPSLSRFSYRTASVLPTRRRLRLAEIVDSSPARFDPRHLRLARRIPEIEAGRQAFVVGKAPRIAALGPDSKPAGEGIASVPFQGTGASEESLLPALPEDPDTLEAALVDAVEPAPPGSPTPSTRLDLRMDLKGAYDPTTVRVLLNATLATHGKTFANEILGDGDAGKENQSFALKQGPLVYLRDPEGGPPISTLVVRVDGVVWEAVGSFLRSRPDARHYVVRLDENQRATIYFGDGRRGARLPTGTANVAATYRAADPDKGAVPPASPAFWDGKPSGLDRVRSLGSGEPASPSVALADASFRARLALTSMGRAVTLHDVSRLARDFADVARADTRAVTTVEGVSALLTILPVRDLAPGEPRTRLLAEVETYVRLRKGFPAPVVATFATPVPYALEVRLSVADDRRESLIAELPEILEERYGYGRWPLGRGLRAPLVAAFLQRQRGVLKVEVQKLGAVGSLEEVPAEPPQMAFASVEAQAPRAVFLASGFTFLPGDVDNRNILILSNIAGGGTRD